MSEVFDIHRFGKLLKLHLRTHIVPIAISWGILLIMTSCVNLLIVQNTETSVGALAGLSVALIVFTFIILFIMSLLASRAFQQYQTRASATPFFMLPCSRVEQYSALTLLYTFLVPLLFILGFGLIEYGFMAYQYHQAMGVHAMVDEDVQKLSQLGVGEFCSFALGFFSIQSLYQTGSIWFKTHPFIKTILSCIAFLVLTTVVSSFFPDAFSDFIGSVKDSLTDSSVGSVISSVFILVVMSALGWGKFRRMVLP